MNLLKYATMFTLFFSISWHPIAIAAGEQNATPTPLSPTDQEISISYEAAIKATQLGPVKIPIADQAVLNLPDNYGFIPQKEAAKLMTALGNTTDAAFQGLIIDKNFNLEWFIDVNYIESGYINDDDARDWNADNLLKNLKEGTEQANTMRRERGIPDLEVVGWIEPPQYEASTQRLVWSIAARNKGQAADAEQGVNYNTLMLGRKGYISMNLVTGSQSINTLKPIAKSILANLAFNEGNRYADFNAETDTVAEYGLAALVAGVAAKKLGLFAIAAAFFVKFAKIILIAAAALIGSLPKLLRKKKAD